MRHCTELNIEIDIRLYWRDLIVSIERLGIKGLSQDVFKDDGKDFISWRCTGDQYNSG